MAIEKTVFTVELQDNGSIKAKTNEMKAFNQEGVKSAAAAKAQSNMYGQARAGGGTGAAGRDFAKESQGLGGLVRVYATFAANIFAVTAAFSALSKAADTANLVKGLDQLGAASGRNLGTLSKQIVEATDGAVSLREAMTATAQTSAAGMSSKDILRLAKGAQQASQALGINMPDALSRLSRGIVKLEPELLDELGIFVRVDKASEDYAKSIGKSAASLTDFEKRAAFASAALTQVETKFGGLNIPVNPYDKLLASLKNVSEAGLNLVNKVFGPIAKYLGESPTALAAVLGLIGMTLLKQAIPALTAWRAQVAAATEESNRAAQETKRLYDEYKAGATAMDTSKTAMAFKKATTAVEEHVKSLNDLENVNKRTKAGRALTGLLADPSNTAKATSALAEYTKRVDVLNNETKKGVTAERAQAIALEIKGLDAARIATDNLVKSNEALKKAQGEYKGVGTGYLSQEAVLGRVAKAAQNAQTSMRVVSNAIENTSFAGPLNAMILALGEVNKAVRTGELQKLPAILTGIKAGAAIAAVGISTLLSSMAGLLNIIGILTAFGALLNTVFTKNGKEASALASSVSALDSAFDNVDKTMALIAKKDPLERLSIDSIQARANAIVDLGDSLTANIDAFNKFKEASTGVFDSAKESIKSFFGYGAEAELSEQLNTAVTQAIKTIDSPEKRAEFKAALKNITGKDLGGSIDVNLGKSVQDLISKTARAAASSAAELGSFKEAMNNTVKASRDFTNTFNLTDPLAKFGSALITGSAELQKLANNSDQAHKGLLELMKDDKKLATFGESFAKGILAIRDAYQEVSREIQKYNDSIAESEAKLVKLIEVQKQGPSAYNIIVGNMFGGASAKDVREQQALDISSNREDFRRDRRQLEAANEKFAAIQVKAREALTAGMVDAFKRGSEFIDMSLKNATERAAITAARGATVGLTGTSAIEAQNKLADAEMEIQLKALRVTEGQIAITTRLNNTMEKIYLQKQIELSEARFEPAAVTNQLKEDLQANLEVGRILEFKGSALSKEINAALAVGRSDKASTQEKRVAIGVAPLREQIAGISDQAAGIKAAQTSRRIEALYTTSVAKEQEIAQVTFNKQKAALALQIDRLAIQDSIVGYQTEESNAAKTALDIAIEKKNTEAEVSSIQAKMNGLLEQNNVKEAHLLSNQLLKQYSKLEEEATDKKILSAQKLVSIEQKGQIAAQKALEESRARDLIVIQSRRSLESSALTNELDIRTAILDKQVSMGAITEDQRNKEQDLINIARIKKDTKDQEAAAQDKLNTLTDTYWDKVFSSATAYDSIPKLEAQFNRDTEAIRNNITEIRNLGEARLKVVEISKKASERETAYNSYFVQSVGTMSDALVDFAATGTQSFKQMIEEMIIGLVKLELRMQLFQSMQAAGGLTGIFNAITGNSSVQPMSPMDLADPSRMLAAKGAAFDSGVKAFAKGGTFTNSVVNSPTLFKFAKGTGMMGEAGPEAIMPLKRDANGNLGVRSGDNQGSVEVIVNNYGSEKAETKESVDSRGNRKIEVIIGDMTAGEVARNGSASQKAMRSTYGIQPQLIRR